MQLPQLRCHVHQAQWSDRCRLVGRTGWQNHVGRSARRPRHALRETIFPKGPPHIRRAFCFRTSQEPLMKTIFARAGDCAIYLVVLTLLAGGVQRTFDSDAPPRSEENTFALQAPMTTSS